MPLVVTLCGVAPNAAADEAAPSDPVVTVVNTDGGLYWRYDTQNSASIPVDGEGVYDGDQVSLQCFERGGTVPPYNNNPLWYRATVVSGQGIGSGLVNDHFLSTGTNQPNQVVFGVGPCGLTTFDNVPATVFGNLDPGKGFGFHDWGPCRVQDFYYGRNGHLIVDLDPPSGNYHVVHGGMLGGWFRNGGAPKLGCPVGDEYTVRDTDGVSWQQQDFDRGKLAWRDGLPWAIPV
jgi:hypothetical protein